MSADSHAELLNVHMRRRRLTRMQLADGLAGELSAKTIDRLLAGEVENPRRSTTAKLDTFFDTTAFGDLSDRLRQESEEHLPDLLGIWFAHTPRQRGRPYATVDRFTVRKARQPLIDAKILRQWSTREPSDVGQEWRAVGAQGDNNRDLYMAFYIVSTERPNSNGALAVRRSLDTWTSMSGFYLRFPAEETIKGAPTFKISFFRNEDDARAASGWDSE